MLNSTKWKTWSSVSRKDILTIPSKAMVCGWCLGFVLLNSTIFSIWFKFILQSSQEFLMLSSPQMKSTSLDSTIPVRARRNSWIVVSWNSRCASTMFVSGLGFVLANTRWMLSVRIFTLFVRAWRMPLFQLWCLLLAPSDSWMRCWISPKNHSLCNYNCHSFSLPINRFSSPAGLVLQDSGCLHFRNSSLFIFKRRKGKKETKVLARGTVVRSKSGSRARLQSRISTLSVRAWRMRLVVQTLGHGRMAKDTRAVDWLSLRSNKKIDSVLVPAFKQGCSFLSFYCNFVSFSYDQ